MAACSHDRFNELQKKKNHIYGRFRIDTTGSSDALILMGICVCFIPRVGSNRCYLSPSQAGEPRLRAAMPPSSVIAGIKRQSQDLSLHAGRPSLATSPLRKVSDSFQVGPHTSASSQSDSLVNIRWNHLRIARTKSFPFKCPFLDWIYYQSFASDIARAITPRS